MDSTKFVEAVKLVVEKQSIAAIRKNLQEPPGRRARPQDIEISNWYRSLDEKDKNYVNQVIEASVTMVVFGFFNVLDGTRVIESTPDKGELELWFKKEGETSLLNDIHKEFLHDIYRGTLPD